MAFRPASRSLSKRLSVARERIEESVRLCWGWGSLEYVLLDADARCARTLTRRSEGGAAGQWRPGKSGRERLIGGWGSRELRYSASNPCSIA